MASSGILNSPQWFAGVLKCRFDFDKALEMRLHEQLGASGADTLARFRSTIISTTAPPLPRKALLGKMVMHGSDIRRPLGLVREHPVPVLTTLAEYYSGTDQVVVAKSRLGGLALEATDGPFRFGSGERVSGPTLAFIMAMTGRASYLDDLSGDGVELLRSRG